jgi:hypothetical protein
MPKTPSTFFAPVTLAILACGEAAPVAPPLLLSTGDPSQPYVVSATTFGPEGEEEIPPSNHTVCSTAFVTYWPQQGGIPDSVKVEKKCSSHPLAGTPGGGQYNGGWVYHDANLPGVSTTQYLGAVPANLSSFRHVFGFPTSGERILYPVIADVECPPTNRARFSQWRITLADGSWDWSTADTLRRSGSLGDLEYQAWFSCY